MSSVRVLVGTKKGGFILTSDGKREKWDVTGPHFAGWEIYHLKGSPVDPNRIYCFAIQRLVRADHPALRRRRQNLGTARHASRRTDKPPEGMPKGESNKFVYDTRPNRQPLTTHQWYDGTQHPWEFKRVWHLEPSLTDPDTVYAGVEDAAMFKSTDGGQTWHELPGLRGQHRRPSGSPAPAAWACTRSCSIRTIPNRIFIAISAAGAFRTDDGGKTWKPINQGPAIRITSPIPTRRGRPLRASHRACTRRSPNTLFMQKHWDVMRTDDAGDNWREVSGNLPTDFGFPIDVHAHEPETIYVVPIKSD